MELHLLDLVMYFLIIIVICSVVKEESLRAIVWVIYTIIYIFVFWVLPVNWVDFFNFLGNINYKV